MKGFIQYIAASLLVFSAFMGCTPQARQSAMRPVAASPMEEAGVDALVASATTDTLHLLTQVSSFSNNHASSLVGRQQVTTSAPAVVAADNVSLLIDSGAVSRDVEISILATTEENSGEIPANMANLTADGAVYRMLPDGQQFEKDITIALRYDSTALPYGYTADDIYTFFYNEQTHIWQQVERDSVDTQNQIVYSRTNHFTDYINGVLKVPESSDAMAYTPTSIKALKAADPMEGITLIAPPEANNQGTANLSYPLNIPAGRRGMQPQLAVNYNSAGGSGILGLGWSLPVSEICVDTRRGVPQFVDTLESETYALDGEVLVTAYTDNNGLLHLNKPAYATPWRPRVTSGQLQFYPRVEGAFRRIVRHGTTTADYYWVVTDKNGTKYFYGDSDASRLKDSHGNIARWCLSRVTDTYGNEMYYTYSPRTYYAPNSTNASRQLLLHHINYTGHKPTGEPGKYTVHFVYAAQDKLDAVTSARFGFLEADAALLDHVFVDYDGNPIKYYVFGYKQGAFGRTLLCNIIEADPETFSSSCSDCAGTVNKGYSNYHLPDITFCGDAKALDTIPFFDFCISDSDYYSDHGIFGDTLNTPVFSRDVYSRCSEMDSTCVHPAYTEHRFSYSGVPLFMLSPTEYITNADNTQDDVHGPLFLVRGNPGTIEGSGTRSWNIGGGLDVGFGWNTFLKSITLGGSYTYSKSNSEGLVSLIDLNGDGFSDKIYKRGDNVYYRLRDSLNHRRFLAEHLIAGVSDFLYSSSTGNSWGVEGCVGADGIGVGFGLNWSDGNSATTTYFSDMDGDGLPDIVRNGQVFYNRIYEDPVNVFQPAASGVGYVVVSSCGRSDTVYIGEPVDESLFADFIDSTSCDTIYKDGKIAEIHCTPYVVPRPYTPNLENVRFWQAPESGYVHITDSARMLPATMASGDGVRLLVQYNGHIVNCDTLLPNADTSFLDTVIYVTTGTRIYFRVLSMDSRTADRLMWNPTIAYCDSPEDTAAWQGTNSVGQEEYRYSYEKDFLISGLQKIKMPFDADVHIDATAYDRTGSSPANYAELQVLVNGNSVLYLPVTGSSSSTFTDLPLYKWDSIQVRIVAYGDINWSNIESQCRIYFTHNNATDSDSLFACVDTLSYDDSTVYFFDYYPQIQKLVYSWNDDPNTVYMYETYSVDDYAKFGTMYRHWGQFAYKAPSNSYTDILQESLLNTSDLSSIQTQGQSSYEGIGAGVGMTFNDENQESSSYIGGQPTYNPLASSFFVMQPDFRHNCWYAYSDYAYIERSMLSNVPHPAAGMTIAQIDSTEYASSMPVYTPGAVAVSKLSFNKSFGISGNVNASIAGYGVNGSVGFTKSQSRQLADMLDLNGDGLPDALSETWAQYTQPFGGLSHRIGSIFNDSRYCEYSLDTVRNGSYGGSAIFMRPQPANSPRHATKSISGNVGSNIGGTRGHGNSATTWVDINGDGLPDKVYSDGHNLFYYQNVGYSLLPRTLFSDGKARHSSSMGFSGSVNFGAAYEQMLQHLKYNNVLNVSITAGLGLSYSSNATDVLTLDLNGDGLPDRLEKHGYVYYIQFNNGNGFVSSNAVLHVTRYYDNVSYSTDLTGAVTAGVTFGFIPLKIEGNPKGGLSRSLSSTEAQWADMNGDGIPDYIWDAGDGRIGVRYSRLGEANRLTKVTLPSGGSYQMSYSLNEDGPESNMRHYVMSSLSVKDNRMQAPDQHRRFQYTSRHYDRIERDDYGYAEVVTIEDSASLNDYRHTVQQFHNQDYLFRGLCHSTAVIDGSNQDTLSATRHEYRLFEIVSGDLIPGSGPGCYGDGFPAMLSDSTLYYDGGQRQFVSRLRFGYTALGNMDTVYDDGALNDPSDDYIVATAYGYLPDYISVVTDEHVFHGSNTFRYRKATHYPTGDIQTLTFQNNAGGDAVYDFKYDIYGNIEYWEQPENRNGQRFSIRYDYDPNIHSLPTKTSNAYGLASYAQYDYHWQKPVWTESVNGARSEYYYDNQGRLSELYAPFEYGTPRPTIRYEYYNRYPQTDAFWRHCRLWARTLNDNNGANYIGTVTISDGLGRPRIVKKEAAVGGQPMRIVSGYTELDALGRKVREYYPDTEALSAPDSTFNSPLSTLNSQLFYDRLDRVTKTVYPDGTFSTSDYIVGNDADGILRLEMDATDQNGHTSYIFSNVREQNTTTIDPLGATTVFHYDHIGQLQESIDPEGHSTYHAYDMLGRRTDRIHPSAGHTRWDYDPAGNMLRLTQNDGQWIAYEYDFNRPTHIEYSNRPWNNVWFEYGPGGSGDIAGRISRQQDATGVQEFRYDPMGNVIFNRHTYVQPHCPNIFTLTTHWQYDSWGRIHNIVYPDGEQVNYGYDFGGMLYDIQGDNTYIKTILYDHFGQRTSMVDGDGIKTSYTYDVASRRLIHLRDSSYFTGELLQDNTYTYDNVGNIISIQDSGRNQRTQIYEYDDADRLMHSEGRMPHEFSTLGLYDYISSYDYSDAGRLEYKFVHSKRYSTALGDYEVNYTNNYHYDEPNNPFAVTKIHGDESPDYGFKWDANGNLLYADGGKPYSDRRLCWTEDNRLQGFMETGDEGGIAAYYNYTADGERNIKLTSPRLDMQQNASQFNNPPLLIPTLYASPLITLTHKGYTKHYFEEGRRVCSKIGGWFLWRVPADDILKPVEEVKDNYEEQHNQQRQGVHETFGKCIGAWPELIDKYDLLKMLLKYKEEEKNFYYHSDHLGSAAYLTSRGDVTQTLNYLPYGEDWIDVQNNMDPRLGQYRFNGKEKDYESGFHYYGARYYWSEILTGWLSVDPMADKYPSISPYNYCVWNPIRIVDPDGRDGWDKIAGFCIGIVTNVVPGTGGLRDAYTPTNSTDYNNGLRTADNTSMVVGGAMVTAGAAGMVAGNTMVGAGAAVAVTGVGAPEGAVVAVAGGAVDATAATVGVIGTTVTMQAALNASQGYNRGGTKNIKDNSHNERHGDGGRAKTKSEKQIEQLKSQLPDASRKERQKIEQKIKNITQNAKKKESGEEHSRVNKR